LTWHDEPSTEWSSCEEDPYWGEEGAIMITGEAEKEILEATQEMHYMCLEAVDKVINNPRLLRMFNIHSDMWPSLRKQWGENGRKYSTYGYRNGGGDKQFDLMGRFDWSWDGVNPPKMLEYNADTPSLFVESSYVSEDWAKD
jgi:glutathionylspermidine synthase